MVIDAPALFLLHSTTFGIFPIFSRLEEVSSSSKLSTMLAIICKNRRKKKKIFYIRNEALNRVIFIKSHLRKYKYGKQWFEVLL